MEKKVLRNAFGKWGNFVSIIMYVLCSPELKKEFIADRSLVSTCRTWSSAADDDSMDSFVTLAIQPVIQEGFTGALCVITNHPLKSVKRYLAKISPEFAVFWFSSKDEFITSDYYQDKKASFLDDVNIVWRYLFQLLFSQAREIRLRKNLPHTTLQMANYLANSVTVELPTKFWRPLNRDPDHIDFRLADLIIQKKVILNFAKHIYSSIPAAPFSSRFLK